MERSGCTVNQLVLFLFYFDYRGSDELGRRRKHDGPVSLFVLDGAQD